MPTIKPRLNVTLSKEARRAISQLAERQAVPDATYAAQLIETALELEEDLVWDRLASRRDQKSAKFVRHTRAWS